MFQVKSKNQIELILSKKNNESLSSILDIEKKIEKLSGTKLRMPKPGTPVALLFSGGLDSTTLLYLLVKKYKLKVYPIVNISEESGLSQKNKILIDSLIEPLRKKYPVLVKAPFFIKKSIVNIDTRNQLISYFNSNPTQLIKEVDINNIFHREIPDLMTQYISPSLQIMEMLKITKKEDINHLFLGIVSNDGDVVKSQSLTAIKSINLNTIHTTRKKKLKIIPFFIEKKFNLYLSKLDVIKIACILNVPIEKTWSCYKPGDLHCGICLDCSVRKANILKAGIEDKTEYLNGPFGKKTKILKILKSKFKYCITILNRIRLK